MPAPPRQTYSLSSFTLSEVTHCGAALRALGAGASTMEEVANRLVRCLHDGLVDERTHEKTLALVRFYKTHPFGALDDGLREFATKILGDAPASPDMKCLTLLASAGDLPEWSSRTASVGHRAIPLPSEQFIDRFPMIAHLIRQFGLTVASLIEPETDLVRG